MGGRNAQCPLKVEGKEERKKKAARENREGGTEVKQRHHSGTGFQGDIQVHNLRTLFPN